MGTPSADRNSSSAGATNTGSPPGSPLRKVKKSRRLLAEKNVIVRAFPSAASIRAGIPRAFNPAENLAHCASVATLWASAPAQISVQTPGLVAVRPDVFTSNSSPATRSRTAADLPPFQTRVRPSTASTDLPKSGGRTISSLSFFTSECCQATASVPADGSVDSTRYVSPASTSREDSSATTAARVNRPRSSRWRKNRHRVPMGMSFRSASASRDTIVPDGGMENSTLSPVPSARNAPDRPRSSTWTSSPETRWCECNGANSAGPGRCQGRFSLPESVAVRVQVRIDVIGREPGDLAIQGLAEGHVLDGPRGVGEQADHAAPCGTLPGAIPARSSSGPLRNPGPRAEGPRRPDDRPLAIDRGVVRPQLAIGHHGLDPSLLGGPPRRVDLLVLHEGAQLVRVAQERDHEPLPLDAIDPRGQAATLEERLVRGPLPLRGPLLGVDPGPGFGASAVAGEVGEQHIPGGQVRDLDGLLALPEFRPGIDAKLATGRMLGLPLGHDETPPLGLDLFDPEGMRRRGRSAEIVPDRAGQGQVAAIGRGTW